MALEQFRKLLIVGEKDAEGRPQLGKFVRAVQDAAGYMISPAKIEPHFDTGIEVVQIPLGLGNDEKVALKLAEGIYNKTKDGVESNAANWIVPQNILPGSHATYVRVPLKAKAKA